MDCNIVPTESSVTPYHVTVDVYVGGYQKYESGVLNYRI
jgi:hypothetical protein